MTWLKQSTTVTIRLGPFLDKTDGVTEEVALGSMGVEVSKNHGAFGARSSATATVHDAEGWYSCELNATDTGTLGPLIVKAHAAATHLPVWREFTVVPAMIYDSMVAGSDRLDTNVTHVADTAQTAKDIGAAVPAAVPGAAGGLFIAGTNAATTVTTSFTTTFTGNLTGSVASVTGAVGSVTGAVGSVTGAVGSVTGNVGGNVVGSVGSVTGAINTAAGVITTLDGLDTAQDSQHSTTQGRLPAALVGGKMDSDCTAISGDSVAADNLESEYDGTGYGQILQRTTIATLASQTSFTLTAGSSDNSAYVGCIAVIQDAATAAQKAVGVIAIYTGATKSVTLQGDPGIFTMAVTDIVTIIADRSLKPSVLNRTLGVTAAGATAIDWANIENQSSLANLSSTTIDPTQVVASVTGNVGGNVDGSVASVTAGVTVTTNNDKTGYALSAAGVNAVSDQVWDEGIAGHAGVGSTGEQLAAAGAAGDPWATAIPGAYGAGTAGKIVGDNLNATISSRMPTTHLAATAGKLDGVALVDTVTTNTDMRGTDNAALATALTTTDGKVDAIKAKTDSLTFTKAGEVDANVQSINGVTITGDGSVTPFGV